MAALKEIKRFERPTFVAQARPESRRRTKGHIVKRLGRATGSEIRALHREAKRLLEDVNFLRHICAGLRGVNKELRTTAKTLIRVLVPLAAIGAVSVPLDPYLYAMLAYLVSTLGVEALCAKIK